MVEKNEAGQEVYVPIVLERSDYETANQSNIQQVNFEFKRRL